jgi:hypothetical protein
MIKVANAYRPQGGVLHFLLGKIGDGEMGVLGERFFHGWLF